MAETLSFENEYGAFTVGSKGASLLVLKISGQDLLYDFGNESGNWAAGAVMFPFPIRMASGHVMNYAGRQFNWPINDEKHRAALHGFTIEQEFQLSYANEGIKCVFSYNGRHDFYPFPCTLELHYALRKEGFFFKAFVQNDGDRTLPFHLGWHPYFSVKSRWELSPDTTFRLAKNEFSHPGPKLSHAGHDWSKEVDGAFFFAENPRLSNEDYSLEISALASIVQIFRPAGASFIAIEPITGLGHPDFDWLEVTPGERREISGSIKLYSRGKQ
jgi:aldose 1-epimerase